MFKLTKTVNVINLRDLKLKGRENSPIKGVVLFDENTPTKFLFSGFFTINPNGKLNMHYHNCEEMQHVIHGCGILRDSENKEYQLSPGTTFYCHAGSKGAHEIINVSDLPLQIIYVYYAPKGKRVSSTHVADMEDNS